MALFASRRALEAELKSDAVQIESREIEILNSNLNSVIGQAALISGFSFAGIDFATQFQNYYIKHSYIACCLLSLCMMIQVIMSGMSITIYGPGLALRGEGAKDVSSSIIAMIKERNRVFTVFLFGILVFLLAAILLTWAFMGQEPALAATLAIAAWMVFQAWETQRIKAGFKGGREDVLLENDTDAFGLGVYTKDDGISDPELLEDMANLNLNNVLQPKDFQALKQIVKEGLQLSYQPQKTQTAESHAAIPKTISDKASTFLSFNARVDKEGVPHKRASRNRSGSSEKSFRSLSNSITIDDGDHQVNESNLCEDESVNCEGSSLSEIGWIKLLFLGVLPSFRG